MLGCFESSWNANAVTSRGGDATDHLPHVFSPPADRGSRMEGYRSSPCRDGDIQLETVSIFNIRLSKGDARVSLQDVGHCKCDERRIFRSVKICLEKYTSGDPKHAPRARPAFVFPLTSVRRLIDVTSSALPRADRREILQ